MTSIFTLDPRRTYPVLIRGEGIHVYDQNGKRYIDGAAGIAVVNAGHGRVEVADALRAQAVQLAYCASNIFSNAEAEKLAGRLVDWAPGDLDHFLFVSGGSEAVEVAIKLARQYFVEQGKQDKHLIVSRWSTYHGATLGALAAGGHRPRRAKFEPLLPAFPHIEPPYCYRCPLGLSHPGCGVECAHRLEACIEESGPERVAAFIAEPIISSAAGCLTPPPEYYAVIREICDRHDVLFIADEVLTGFGRSGREFAIEHYGLVPDLLTMGKGISGGYSPLGAVAVSARVRALFEDKQAPFSHIFTYSANPLAAAAGNAMLDIMEREDLVGHAGRAGAHLFQRSESLRQHPLVGDIRGRGLMLGLELVQDRGSKEPFPSGRQMAARFQAEALERGLITYPGSGAIDGERGDHVCLYPPLVVTEADIDAIVAIMGDTLDALLKTGEDGGRPKAPDGGRV